jgi:excisionase family DNA binding protein
MSLATSNFPGLKTADEAADILGIDASLVRRYCRDGDLKGQQLVGRIWLIPVEEIDRFSKVQRPVGNPEFRKKNKSRRKA